MSARVKHYLSKQAAALDNRADQDLEDWHKLRAKAELKLAEVQASRALAQAYRDDIEALERAGR